MSNSLNFVFLVAEQAFKILIDEDINVKAYPFLYLLIFILLPVFFTVMSKLI